MTEIKKNSIILQNKGGVSYIILNQPDKHNALSPTMIEELSDAFENLSKDEHGYEMIKNGPCGAQSLPEHVLYETCCV